MSVQKIGRPGGSRSNPRFSSYDYVFDCTISDTNGATKCLISNDSFLDSSAKVIRAYDTYQADVLIKSYLLRRAVLYSNSVGNLVEFRMENSGLPVGARNFIDLQDISPGNVADCDVLVAAILRGGGILTTVNNFRRVNYSLQETRTASGLVLGICSPAVTQANIIVAVKSAGNVEAINTAGEIVNQIK